MNLHNQYLGKAINNQPRQTISFGVYQAIGNSFLGVEYLPQCCPAANALAHEFFIDGLPDVTREDAYSNIRVGVIVATRHKTSRGRFDIDQATRLDPMRGLLQCAGEDPEVPVEQALLATRFQAGGGIAYQ